MNLKFRDYLIDPSLSKADVDNCFQQAEMECGVREKQSTEMEEGETQSWENGDVYLDIVPKKGKVNLGRMTSVCKRPPYWEFKTSH